MIIIKVSEISYPTWNVEHRQEMLLTTRRGLMTDYITTCSNQHEASEKDMRENRNEETSSHGIFINARVLHTGDLRFDTPRCHKICHRGWITRPTQLP